MKPDNIKAATEAVRELNESYVDVIGAVKTTAYTIKDTKKL